MASQRAIAHPWFMRHLQLVPDLPAERDVDDRPRVSLRLLMAASGRCACDDCLLAYRRGNKGAGIVQVGAAPARLTSVR